MTKQEADAYIIGYWERTAKENDERAAGLEKLAPNIVGAEEANFVRFEAKQLREQAERFRERAKVWRAKA